MELGYALAIGALVVGAGMLFLLLNPDSDVQEQIEQPAPETVQEEQGIPPEELPIVTPQQQDETGAWVVHIRDYYYDPGHITIKPGETVKWVNDGEKNHYVISLKGRRILDSRTIRPGESWSYIFDETPGKYEYTTPLHQGMFGSVTLVEETSNSLKERFIALLT